MTVAGAAPAPSPRLLARRCLDEVPLLLGIFLGSASLLAHVHAQAGVLSGSDWQVYLDSAAALARTGLPWMRVHDWRGLLHPLVVSQLGAHQGYAASAATVSAAAAVIAVGSAGLLGRALSGSVAGGMAALAASAFQPLREASVWLNSYSLQGATVGAAFAFGAAACRWPGIGLSFLAGVVAALARIADPRGLVATPVVLVLVAAGATATSKRRAVAILVVTAVGLTAPVWAADRYSVAHGIQFRSLQEVIHSQQAVQAGGALDVPSVRARCHGESPDVRALLGECATTLRSENLTFLSQTTRIPDARLLWLGLGLLLPAWWGWRSTLACVVVFAVPLVGEFVSLSLVGQDKRYLVWLTVPFAAFVPVAVGRMTESLTRLRFPPLGAALIALPTTAFLVTRIVPIPVLVRAKADDRLTLATWARTTLQGADTMLDCADASIVELVLPARISTRPLPADSPECPQYAASPPATTGRVFLVTSPTTRPAEPMNSALRSGGWTQVQCGGSGPPCSEYLVWQAP